MPAFEIEKSIVIAAPCESIYPLVRDFKNWKAWSPWLIAEPDAKLEYSEEPDAYSWDGRITGSGSMELVTEESGKSMDCRLLFLKPWKSESSVRFEFSETSEGTKVTWKMKGSLPFFMFFLKGMMTALIGMDYERGLKMLKDLAESGSVPSVLSFTDEKEIQAFKYVGVKSGGKVEDIENLMKSAMSRLGTWREESGIEPAGVPFAIYHKWQIAKGMMEFTFGCPVDSIPEVLPEGLSGGEMPACRVYEVRHTGPYRHVGNAWSAGEMHGRAKLFRQSSKLHPFEIYETDPEKAPDEKEIVTLVNFPVK
ncbi:MAG: SRPBCC family protein [Luteolibacter sp.]